MPFNSYRVVAVMCAAASLAACAAPRGKPYHAPDPSLPTAQLTISPHAGQMRRHETEQLEWHDMKCMPDGTAKHDYMLLGKWEAYTKAHKPAQVVLPAGRILFDYDYSLQKDACRASFAAQLEAGHAYTLKMEKEYKGWLGSTGCHLAMVDTTTGLPVRLESRHGAGDAYYPQCGKAAAGAVPPPAAP
jgi:hypothetical protein